MTSAAFSKAISGGGGVWELISYNPTQTTQYYLPPVSAWTAGPANTAYSKLLITYTGTVSQNTSPWLRITYSDNWDGVSGNQYIYSAFGYAYFGNGHRGTYSSDPYNNYNNIQSQMYFTNALSIYGGQSITGEIEIQWPTETDGHILGRSRSAFYTSNYNDEFFVDAQWHHGAGTGAIRPTSTNWNTVGVYISGWNNFSGTWSVYGLKKEG